jgi:opacity protein-like surface antigen
MKFRSLFASFLVCTFALIGLSNAANAQTSRIYFAGYLGLNKFNDLDFTESTVPAQGSFRLSNSTTFAGALGIRLTSQLRLEGEYSYGNADLTSVDIASVGSFDTGGELKSKIIFANLYYDFDLPWKIQPFIGGGLGYGWHSGEISSATVGLTNASGDSDGIMYNLGGGFKYRPRDDLAFTAGYRYVDSISDQTFGSFDVNMGSHEFRLGLEWDLPIVGQ